MQNQALLAAIAATALLAGQASQAAIYVNDNFEGEAIGTFSATANSTKFINTAPGDNGKVNINASFASTATPLNTADDPAGQRNLRIRGNKDKHVTMLSPMPLLADNATGLDISFKLHFNSVRTQNILRVIYSANGTFSDQQVIQSMSTNATADPGNYVFRDKQWYNISLQIPKGDANSGYEFTDTAKIRFAQDGGGANNTHAFIDDVVIQSLPVPEPTSLALLGIGGLMVARRRRG